MNTDDTDLLADFLCAKARIEDRAAEFFRRLWPGVDVLWSPNYIGIDNDNRVLFSCRTFLAGFDMEYEIRCKPELFRCSEEELDDVLRKNNPGTCVYTY